MNGTYQVIKNGNQPVYQHGSPFEAMSIQKKLQRHAQRNHSGANYQVSPPVCPDCECPILFSIFTGYVCECEPE
ncbi:hypothetical protein [Dictyobacter arantiisoli]|uniref:Uncharacterized protein n=1 Tax=Dictyobacter arantiisoli TaxID=2014874 RepID=A0A5A5T7H6_9CHLR|nr:hypothetical protein [Dictyobacter arantiisoli]GCF07338.1 hypothetical protein KDI_09020 [Dictyobacter arantiisoli]